MRPLSLRSAASCENASGPVCHCRCGGKLHGAARHLDGISEEISAGSLGGVVDVPPEFLQALSEDDPHYVPNAQRKAERRRMANQKIALIRAGGQKQ